MIMRDAGDDSDCPRCPTGVPRIIQYLQETENRPLSPYSFMPGLPWQFLYFLPLPQGQGSLG